MNSALWVMQGLLALLFLGAGSFKVSQSKERLVQRGMGWVAHMPMPIVRLIGGLEIAGAGGLVLPALTGILPWLPPVAAVGLSLTMVGAAITNLTLHDSKSILINLVILALAAGVAYGRFVMLPL